MRVPVVLLTGWLGSGKTTLLNRILREGAGRLGRLAVLVNELGDVGLDADLIPAGAARQVELAGGCICCQLDSTLERTLVELLARPPAPSLVIVETTGVADPLPIGWTLEAEALAPLVRLAAVVTVVDLLEQERSRPLADSVDAQVRNADLLVVSKLDLAADPEAALAALTSSLRARNRNAPILAVPPERQAAALLEALADPAMEDRVQVQVQDEDHDHDHHGHPHDGHGLHAIGLALAGTYDLDDLGAALEALPADIVRIEGVARVIDGTAGEHAAKLVAFHRVGTRFSYDAVDGAIAPRVVAIGRDPDEGRLAACFAAAVVRSEPGRGP